MITGGNGEAGSCGVQLLCHRPVVDHRAFHLQAANVGGLAVQDFPGGGGGVGGADILLRNGLHRDLTQHLAGGGGNVLGRLGGDGGLFLGGDGYRAGAGVVTGGNGVGLFGGAQGFGHRADVGHGTSGQLPFLRHNVLVGQHVGSDGRHTGHVLVLGGDDSNRHVGQAVIAGVGGHILLLLGRGDLLALKLVVAASGGSGNRAAAVVVALGDGVGVALRHGGGYRALVCNAVKGRCQRVHLCGALGNTELNGLVAQGVPCGFNAGNFGLDAHGSALLKWSLKELRCFQR